MQILTVDFSENTEGVMTLEAMASTGVERHAAALAEARQLLDWAWQHFPDSHGAFDAGNDWDHDLQVTVEDGHWHVVALTLAGTPAFFDALCADFAGLAR